MLNSRIAIRKVEARCPAQTEPLAARLRLEHLLQCSDLMPPGFPPQAILLVKRVAATRQMSLSAVRPTIAWESGVRETIAQLYRRAARPVLGLIPATTDAVLFEDVGELLACLGLDLLSRVVEQRWYWRSLLSSDAVSSSWALVRAWSEMPRFIPAAAVRLIRLGAAARVLNILAPAEANSLISLIEGEFNVSLSSRVAENNRLTERGGEETKQIGSVRLSPSDRRPIDESSRSAHRPVSRSSSMSPLDLPLASDREPEPVPLAERSFPNLASAPPWRRWLSYAGSECERLSPAIHLLLSTAVAVFFSPSTARSEDYGVEVTAWLGYIEEKARNRQSISKEHKEQSRHDFLTDSASRGQGIRSGDFDSKNTLRRRSGQQVEQVPSENARRRRSESSKRSKPRATETALRANRGPRPVAPLSAAESGERTQLPNAADAVTQAEHLEKRDAKGPLEQSASADELKPWTSMEGIETDLGGALYLINVMSWLDLPACFDDQLSLSEHIGGWALVEMFARCLLSSGEIDINERDALWPLLAQLDGRSPRARVAPRFPDTRSLRVPVEWIEQLRSGDLSPISPAVIQTWRLGRASKPLREWLGRVFPYVRRTLAVATGEHDIAEQALARLILLRRARVYCTATHLDVVMSIELMEPAVRRAGLDLNPGWRPDLMRVVSFAFE